MATTALSATVSMPFSEKLFGDFFYRGAQGVLVVQKQCQCICRGDIAVRGIWHGGLHWGVVQEA